MRTAALLLALAAVEFHFEQFRLGVSVAKLIASNGAPAVVNADVGHIWSWEENDFRVRVISDDAGSVQMVDIIAPPARWAHIRIPAIAAGSALPPNAETGITNFPDSGLEAEFTAYALSPRIYVVELRNDRRQLGELFYGAREVMARNGLLRTQEATSPKLTAPVLLHQGTVDYPSTHAQGDTYVRIAVNKSGSVSNARIFQSSGDADLDGAALAAARMDTFSAALQEGKPVDSVYFARHEFRQLSPG
ncbi:MAG: hypothetical protein DLM50_04760 [Candidatus Meridianibacter frigidus]|nr:MAG: hypothetical protein DLM50_04760 [Candidatus Eremiobacteraeota bacterium]